MLLRDQAPTVGGGSLRLLWLIGGGLGVGLIIGRAIAWVERWVDASGVLAVVACGLYLSRKSVDFFSPAVRIQVWGAWGALDFVHLQLRGSFPFATLEGQDDGVKQATATANAGILAAPE